MFHPRVNKHRELRKGSRLHLLWRFSDLPAEEEVEGKVVGEGKFGCSLAGWASHSQWDHLSQDSTQLQNQGHAVKVKMQY